MNKNPQCECCGKYFSKPKIQSHQTACVRKWESEIKRFEEEDRIESLSRDANREMGIDESLLDEDWGNK